MQICGYQFAGPYDSTYYLEDRSGVYMILDQRSDGRYMIDVGESHAVKNRVANHDRSSCWKRNSHGKLILFVLYTPNLQQSGRKEIEQQIRKTHNAPCGER